MTLRAFRGNRFESLLEIFILNSRRFYNDLPTRRTGASSLPPSAWSPRTIIRLTIPQADAPIPGVFSLGLCQDWVSHHNPFMLSGDFGKWAREMDSRLAHKVIKFHFFT
jgi:hypothetical protein